MPALPLNADLDQLRHRAKDLLRLARRGDRAATESLAEISPELRLATAQLRIARDHGFSSWPALVLEVSRRRILSQHDDAAIAAFVKTYPGSATTALQGWVDHPKGASPLGFLAMARYDTTAKRWREVTGTAAAAHVLLAAGAPVDGPPGAPETPLITAASYGDVELVAMLIAAGADLDALSSADAGGVPLGSALLHAAVFGMTEVLDVLAAAGAKVRSLEEAAAVGDLCGWLTPEVDVQTKLRALVMAADHQRAGGIAELVQSGAPVDGVDVRFRRHPLRLAASNGRVSSVAALLAHGADPRLRDAHGRSPLDLCRLGRTNAIDTSGHDAVETLLLAAAGAS